MTWCAIAAAATLGGCAGAAPRTQSAIVSTAGENTPGPADVQPQIDSAECRSRSLRRMLEPMVIRFPAQVPGNVRRPDRIISGPRTALCEPTAIAGGPKGEVYVLNRRKSGDGRPPVDKTRWKSWVTAYDTSATGDATPTRTLRIDLGGFDAAGTLAVDGDGYLYVGGSMEPVRDSGSVAVFAPGAGGDVAPVRVIGGYETGLRRPEALALDRRGNVYVANGKYFYRDDAVRMFAPAASGDVAPTRVLSLPGTGSRRPVALAIDSKERLYVASGTSSSQPGLNTVVVFDSGGGDTTPIEDIEGSPQRVSDGMRSINGLAIDSHDSVYVRSERNLTVFGPESAATRTLARTFHLNVPQVFALDPHDTLYALTGNTISVYPPGYAGGGGAVRTVGPPQNFGGQVSSIAVDRSGWLYVAIRKPATILIFAPGASGDVPPARTIAGARTRLVEPTGLVVDDKGRLYVANGPQSSGSGAAIRVYAPDARGEMAPARTLTGPATRLSTGPIALDSKRQLYVGATNIVAVYRSGASGDERPIRTIEGPETQLRGVMDLSIGPGDSLYALNGFGDYIRFRCGVRSIPQITVTVYAPGASGAAEPVRSLVVTRDYVTPGLARGLTAPHTLAVGPKNEVQVWQSGTALIYPAGATGSTAPARLLVEELPDEVGVSAVTAGEDGWIYELVKPAPPIMVC